jgi:hypothetical protein
MKRGWKLLLCMAYASTPLMQCFNQNLNEKRMETLLFLGQG